MIKEACTHLLIKDQAAYLTNESKMCSHYFLFLRIAINSIYYRP